MSRSRPAYSASGTLVPSARVAVKSWVVVVIVLRSGVVLRPTVRRSGRSAAPEDGYEEVGGFLQRSQVPRGEQEVGDQRSEEHTSELQSRGHLVCRLLLD